MTNPYESVPNWYVLFYKIYRPVWWVGTLLIVASWFTLVPPNVGWVGFGLACAAVLGSCVLPSLAGVKPEDYVVLDSRLLKSKGETYSDAMGRFTNGATLVYDGVGFGFRPENVIACGVVAHSPTINEAEARDVADHAQSVFDTLKGSSPDFASAVAGHTFRISIMSSMDANATELFCVIGDKVEPRS